MAPAEGSKESGAVAVRFTRSSWGFSLARFVSLLYSVESKEYLSFRKNLFPGSKRWTARTHSLAKLSRLGSNSDQSLIKTWRSKRACFSAARDSIGAIIALWSRSDIWASFYEPIHEERWKAEICSTSWQRLLLLEIFFWLTVSSRSDSYYALRSPFWRSIWPKRVRGPRMKTNLIERNSKETLKKPERSLKVAWKKLK